MSRPFYILVVIFISGHDMDMHVKDILLCFSSGTINNLDVFDSEFAIV